MATSSDPIRQAAAIPVREGRICLVMSSSGKRWVIPKGCIERGQTAGVTALQEAWEEAGVVGTLKRQPVGSYVYKKCGLICHVTVFIMEVTKVTDEWPEGDWRAPLVLSRAAQDRIEDEGLRRLLGRIFSIEAMHIESLH